MGRIQIQIPKLFFKLPELRPRSGLDPVKEQEREKVEMMIQRDVAITHHVSSAIRENLMRNVLAEVRFGR